MADLTCKLCGTPIEADYIAANVVRRVAPPTMCAIHARHTDGGTGQIVACEDPACPLCGDAERGTVIGHHDDYLKA